MDSKTIRKAKELIKKFEGLSLEAYKCPGGYLTIGYGHKMTDKANWEKITKEMAENLLERDICTAYECLLRNTKGVDLNSNQTAALLSFIFNLGGGAFQSSTLRQKLLRGEYHGASLEIIRYVYSKGVKLNGLIRRRQAEQNLFNTKEKTLTSNNDLNFLGNLKHNLQYVVSQIQGETARAGRH